ncbi:phosphatase PAP2 family protein [Staphylococcus sp. 11007852]|uniref:phosphatase PAP2 family protein n=1 Tax=Staphylococcus sp. 11007852 TaxID=2714543 RepID=UPI001404105B|nr:phosphatase PAP2 family protein [Staphylococcus sp. 11007852]NHM74219.1 phosphatase PAP2 family protein [Staphylococcus sp. 11007852]NJH82969.1 phosphatase PAP2 family protein [Staphylococcus agnetis]
MKVTSMVSSLIFIIIMSSVALRFELTYVLDHGVFNWMMAHFGEPQMVFNHGLFNDYMTFVATYGDVLTFVILTIIGAVILMVKKYYLFALWMLATVASGGIIGFILKALLHRLRPYDHLLNDTGFSFPSGHSLSSTLFIMLIVLVFIPKIRQQFLRWSLVAVVMILWMSILFSRLYFHAHFITDVIGGVTFGLFWVNMSLMLYQLNKQRFDVSKYIKNAKAFHIVYH